MLGDRDFRGIVEKALDTIGDELEIDVSAGDTQTIHLHEAVRCLRRSYYDRTDPVKVSRRGFGELISGLLGRLEHSSKPGKFAIDEISLVGRADMVADDSVFLFRGGDTEMEEPLATDVLYLNACMWIYDKEDGIIVYIGGDRTETTFAISRNKRMFEEVVRRVRVLNDLLKEQKTPILEPSAECSGCQYYERCFAKRKNTKQLDLAEMLGLGKKDQ